MAEWTLGLGGSDHDFSAALMYGSDIRVAIEQERLTRKKHSRPVWFESPVRESIEYCLTAEGITINDVRSVVSSDQLPLRIRHELKSHDVLLFPHHLCHAASAYMMLPTDANAGIIVYDGYGSTFVPKVHDPVRSLRETFSFFLFESSEYRCLGQTFGEALREDDYPICVTNSVGLLYELVTAKLGYEPLDSGKTMGLSSYGVPRYLDRIERFIGYGSTLSACFECSIDDPLLSDELERILIEGKNTFSVKADLAATAQAIVNKTLLHCAQLLRHHPIEHLCVAGGCGLNTVANTFLVNHLEDNVPVFIPPHAGDSGLGFGALWLKHVARDHNASELTFRGSSAMPGLARPGRLYSREECRVAAQQYYPRVALDASVRSASDLARVIADRAVVGVFHGGSEVGPRALGGRSIMADAQSVHVREVINRTMKRREPFRPLAPIILHSRYDDYFFDGRAADPFMLKVARIRDRCRTEAPAIVHVDDTARVQVVDDQNGDPFLVELLLAFSRTTGRNILLNTSFNRRGEPLVETPLDAIDAFLGLNLDGLYLEGDFYRAVAPTSPRT
jgi:carbamoyltransferase